MEDGNHNNPDPEMQNPFGSTEAGQKDNPEKMDKEEFEMINMLDVAEIENEEETNPPKDGKVENDERKALVKSVNFGTSEGLSFLASLVSLLKDWLYNYPVTWISSWWSPTVGIFTESQQDDCEWLVNLLRSDVFKCHVREIKLYEKPEHQQTLQQDVSSLSRVIIYKSGGHSDNQSNPCDLIAELGKQLPYYALKNVRIVVGDLENIESAKTKWGKIATGDSWKEPILYTRSDINLFMEKQELLCQRKEKLEQIVKIMTPTQGYAVDLIYTFLGPYKHTVGIFSRDSQEVYQWLIDSEDIERAAGPVKPYYISNSGYRQFYQDVSECSFGILYHTKNRGRINVTNVTDSLYDEELKYLSDRLGKQNVIVVIDDVDQCSPELQKNILANQPSIGTFARELFIFSKAEKVTWEKLQALRTWIKSDL